MVKTKIRLALTVITAVFCCVLLYKVFTQESKLNYQYYDDYGHGLQLRRLNQPFSWHEDETEDKDSNNDERRHEGDEGGNSRHHDGGDNDGNKTHTPSTCRNSVQGRLLMADDRGYLCHRQNILHTGCCDPDAASSKRYNCEGCNEVNGCCDVYEHCISCCMDPSKKPVLMQVLNEAKNLRNILLMSVKDHFELCLAKCRTSSSSVQHENIYINPGKKFCFMREQASGSSGGNHPKVNPDPPP